MIARWWRAPAGMASAQCLDDGCGPSPCKGSARLVGSSLRGRPVGRSTQVAVYGFSEPAGSGGAAMSADASSSARSRGALLTRIVAALERSGELPEQYALGEQRSRRLVRAATERERAPRARLAEHVRSVAPQKHTMSSGHAVRPRRSPARLAPRIRGGLSGEMPALWVCDHAAVRGARAGALPAVPVPASRHRDARARTARGGRSRRPGGQRWRVMVRRRDGRERRWLMRPRSARGLVGSDRGTDVVPGLDLRSKWVRVGAIVAAAWRLLRSGLSARRRDAGGRDTTNVQIGRVWGCAVATSREIVPGSESWIAVCGDRGAPARGILPPGAAGRRDRTIRRQNLV